MNVTEFDPEVRKQSDLVDLAGRAPNGEVAKKTKRERSRAEADYIRIGAQPLGYPRRTMLRRASLAPGTLVRPKLIAVSQPAI
jgi:hypothetical protein